MSETPFAPIVLFLYNRLKHTEQTVAALQKNDLAQQSDLYVFCDGPKQNATIEQIAKVQEVQSFAEHISGFKNVYLTKQSQNKGLANSVINGVSNIIKKHGRVIVVEDDIITHPFFLRFMNDVLSFYEKDKRIYKIGGMTDEIDFPKNYNKDVLVSQRVESWGWATWADRWFSAEWDITKYPIFRKRRRKDISKFCRGGDDLWPMLQAQAKGEIDSWAVRWQYNMSQQNKWCLRPVYSFVTNVGLDGSGVHCGSSDTGTAKTTPLYRLDSYNIKLEHNIKENGRIRESYRRYYSIKPQEPLIIRAKVFVYNILLKVKKHLSF